ncbi:hypothetical protein [Lutimonas sp.]
MAVIISHQQTIATKELTRFRNLVHENIDENFPNAEIEIVFGN